MSWIVILSQLILPLFLLTWLALFPATAWLRGLQLISVAAILLAIALTALWTMPPFWTPLTHQNCFGVSSF